MKSAVSGSFYVHHHKPDFCELFVICGGRRVFLRGENSKGVIEDDQGVTVAKIREKSSFKAWLAKMFNENPAYSLDTIPHPSLGFSTNPYSSSSQNQRGNCVQELENYFQHLLSLKMDEGVHNSPMELATPEHADSDMVSW